MSLMISLVGYDLSDDTVNLPEIDFTAFLPENCYSGARFDSNGLIYKNGGTSSDDWIEAGTWLLKGSAANYDLHRTVNSGELDTDDGDDQNLNTGDLDYYVIDTTAGVAPVQAEVTFEIKNVAGTTTYATRTYNFYALKEDYQ